MVKSTVTKFKQVCGITLLPRLICGEIHSVPWRFQKIPVRTQKRTRKSTRTSGFKMETEKQKCQRIIDRVFEPNPPVSELFKLKQTQNSFALFPPDVPTKTETHYEKYKRIMKKLFVENFKSNNNNYVYSVSNIKRMKTTSTKNEEGKLLQNKDTARETLQSFDLNPKQNSLLFFTSNVPPKNESHCEKCQRIINAIFGDENKIDFKVNAYLDKTQIPYTETIKSTTAKDNEEKLVQKIENIDESHLEGAYTPEIEGLNMNPKMLGRRKQAKSISHILSPKLGDNSFLCDGKKSTRNVPTFDELARRCLDSPTNQIDKQLLKEMVKLGVPASGRRVPDKVNENELVQAEIMEKHRKPENPSLDLMSLKNNDLEKMQMELSPPYELSIGKSYNSSVLETKNEFNDINAIKEKLSTFLSNRENELKHRHIQDIHENNQRETNQDENIKIIRNLLQTRIEHLTQIKVKQYHLTNNVVHKTEPEARTEIDFKLERITPNRIKENENILTEDEPPYPEHGVVLKDYNINESPTDKKFDHISVKTLNLQAEDEFMHPSLYYSDSQYSDYTHNNWYSQYIQTCNTEVEPQYYRQIEASEEIKYKIENPKQYKTEEPILAVETSRLISYDSENDISIGDHKLEIIHTKKEPMTNLIHPENLAAPLLDKGTVINIENNKIDAKIPALDLSNLKTNNETTLSELLRKVRERNKQEYCRELTVRMQRGCQVESAFGKSGIKSPSCPPPAPVCPKPVKPICPPSKPKCPPSKPVCPPQKPICPPPKPVCPSPKPTCPKPCKPKCPPSPPPPCVSTPRCPPAKKNPCNNYTCDKIYDALTLLSYLGPHFHVTQKNMMPIFACTIYLSCTKSASRTKIDFTDLMSRLRSSCNIVLLACFQNQERALEAAIANSLDFTYAKSYEPWSPIPSLPFPEKITKKKLICPKEGCKVTPPKLNTPCSNVNPCINLPKPNSFTKH